METVKILFFKQLSMYINIKIFTIIFTNTNFSNILLLWLKVFLEILTFPALIKYCIIQGSFRDLYRYITVFIISGTRPYVCPWRCCWYLWKKPILYVSQDHSKKSVTFFRYNLVLSVIIGRWVIGIIFLLRCDIP